MSTIQIYHQALWSLTERSDEYAEKLEQGNILFFPNLDFELLNEEKIWLDPKCVSDKVKNISFDPNTEKLFGLNADISEHSRLKNLLHRYAQTSKNFLLQLFPHYQAGLSMGRTTYRPVEIAGRKAPSYRKDDTRLHVDAFPSKPNQGKRILRVFTNINPEAKSRHWHIGEPFPDLIKRFWPVIPPYKPWFAKLLYQLKMTRSLRSEYDHIMLELHNRMKKDLRYQKTVPKIDFHFPVHSSWIVFTDQVSHAALSGQYVLEQTFHLPVESMKNPQASPLRLIRKLLEK